MDNPPQAIFYYEIEASEQEPGIPLTTFRCHGRLVSETAGRLKDVIKPRIPQGGRIVLDLSDVSYMDSSGLGTLVGLKVSAMREGYCRLELINLSPRIADLLRLSNLTQLFSS